MTPAAVRLLYVTYRIDPDDTLVGFVVGWLTDLAAHVNSIDVVCLSAAPTALPDNVRVHPLGKGSAGGLAWRLKFWPTVWRLRRQVNTVLCQFSPEYVLAVAPVALLRGWPIVLWYTHRHVGLKLRLAMLFVRRVVTASEESFQLDTPKRQIIGHGIDLTRFALRNQPPSPRTIVAVGRRSPIKHYELLIDAARILVHERGLSDLRVRIVGGDEGHAPPGYAADLADRIARYDLQGRVTLVGAVPFPQVPAEYAGATVHVNLCPTGGLDKAVLEGMAVGVPTLVRNAGFAPLLGEDAAQLVLPDTDPAAIADRLHTLLSLPAGARQALGQRLHDCVVAGFSQQALVGKLAEQLALAHT